MDRLQCARVFVEVAERSSLAQAAERLDMSAAMVSRYLAAAEQWLGARLLHRTTRRVSLTESGEAALSACRQLLELAEELQQRTGGGDRVAEGRLRVSSSASFAETHLAAALVEFQQRHPRIRLELLVVARAVDLVEDRIDLAVRISRALDPQLVSRPLAACRSVLCAAPAYVQRRGLPRDIDALRQHACVGHSFGPGNTYRLTRGTQSAAIELTSNLTINETTIVQRAVLAGGGFALLPTYACADDLRQGRLLRLLPDWEPEVLGIHAVYLSRRHQPLRLRLLVDFLAERFAGDPAPWDEATAALRPARRSRPTLPRSPRRSRA